MRIRNVKNKEEILDNCSFLLNNPKEYKGKFKELFNNDNPIYLEIGMGKGQFIYQNAKKYKDINFIGIERFDSIMAKAILKMEKLDNLILIKYDANLIDDLFDHEIDKIYLNFSDPWPKNRHENRRLTSKLFLEKYKNIFKDKERIEVRTDNRDFFLYSVESLGDMGYLLNDVSFNYQSPDLIMTEYESKFRGKGANIYHFFAEK
ncbi:MAG: tRNA (guanosine(46)-N7)-methyltransferase TrmB [Clostridium sp.]|nr:tRNA (guanosine(46)-N7)-methyltransferase TrmB [Clostridium sp.]CDE73473.1 tRNA (guanine-N(7)-)-methyltransferase [Clostridium sp. CAG:451]